MRLSSDLDRPCKCYGNIKIIFSKNVRDFPDNREINHKTLLVILALQVTDKSCDIGQVVFCGRFREFQVFLFNRRQKTAILLELFKIDLPDTGSPPGTTPRIQNTCIDSRFYRNANNNVAFYAAQACLPVSGSIIFPA